MTMTNKTCICKMCIHIIIMADIIIHTLGSKYSTQNVRCNFTQPGMLVNKCGQAIPLYSDRHFKCVYNSVYTQQYLANDRVTGFSL